MIAKYNFLNYVINRFSFIVLGLFLCGLISFILGYCNINKSVIILVIVCVVVVQFIQIVFEYAHSVKYWKFLSNYSDPDVNTISLLQQPSEIKAAVSYDFIENISVEAQNELNKLNLSNSEYRSYIESWVHEIKTPLAAATLILANHPSEENRQILSELRKTESYVEQALYYARVGSVDRDYSVKEVNLEDLVNSSIKSRMYMLIESNTKVVINDLDHNVVCDNKWIEFILGQLIDNAIKYKDNNKNQPILTFDYEVENEGTAREVRYLCIKDNGLGIDDKDVKRIFDKGFVGSNGRAFNKERSTGIGLYLVSEMCKKMSVQIICNSVKGEFTEMKLGFEILGD